MVRNGDDILVIAAGGKLLLSTDNGINWNLLSPETWSGRKIAIDGDNIFVGGVGYLGKPEFWISKNYGKDWISIRDTLSGLKAENFYSLSAKDGYIYAGTSNGFFISTNVGESWSKSDYTIFDWELVVCSLALGDTVFAGSETDLYISTDKGATWDYTKLFRTARMIISHNNKIYVASDGLAISTDNEEIWDLKLVSGGSHIFCLQKYNNSIFAGTYRDGVYVSDNQCETWERFDVISEFASVYAISFMDSSIFYTNPGPALGKLFYSNDFGQNWNIISNHDSIRPVNVIKYTIDFQKKNVFLHNYYGVYISEDFGENWRLFHDDLRSVYSKNILINEEKIYISDLTGIFYSSDYGINWTKYNSTNGLPDNNPISSLAICNDNLIVGTNSETNSKGILLSTNNGNSWNAVSDTSLPVRIRDLITYDNFVFAGTTKGIILSSDCGVTWYRPDNFLNHLSIYELLILGEYIYAATAEGVFKANLSDFGITGVKEEISVKNNYLYAFPPYPLPARNYIKSLIYWDTSIDIGNDEINIYDIFGNKVSGKEKISIEQLNNYSGILTWDCSEVVSGIYLIHIKHGTRQWTLKTVVDK
jgi:photosystem II stability/assembly factor-like uncharacterized protein